MSGRLFEDVLAITREVAAFVACLDDRLERDAVGRRPRRVATWMSLRPATELEDGVVAKNVDEVGHVPNMNAAGSRGEHRGEGSPGLVEVHTAAPVGGNKVLTAQGVDRHRAAAVALQLAHHSAVVDVVAARHPQPLGAHPPVDALVLLAIE